MKRESYLVCQTEMSVCGVMLESKINARLHADTVVGWEGFDEPIATFATLDEALAFAESLDLTMTKGTNEKGEVYYNVEFAYIGRKAESLNGSSTYLEAKVYAPAAIAKGIL